MRFVKLQVIDSHASRKQIAEAHRHHHAFDAREAPGFARLPHFDVLGYQATERIDRELPDLGAEAVSAQRAGNTLLESKAEPNFPQIDDRCG